MKDIRFDDINSELVLENKIFEEFCNHRLLQSEVRVIEKNFDKFLMEYYREIGGLIEQIEYVDLILEIHEINVYGANKIVEKTMDSENIICSKKSFENRNSLKFNKPNPYKKEENQSINNNSEEEFINTQMNDEDDDKAFNKEINRIYRTIVKFCHPDSSEADPDAKEAFSMLYNAYKNKDLKTLLSLERIFIGNETLEEIPKKSSKNAKDNKERLNLLKEQYAKIKNENKALVDKKKSLRKSDMFLLQRRIKWAKICGNDMLKEIKNSTQKELNKKIIIIEKMGIDINIEDMNIAKRKKI